MRQFPFAALISVILALTSPVRAQERLADLLSDPATRLSRPLDRSQVVARMKGLENTRRQNSRARATRLGLPLRTELSNGRIQEIADFDGDRPLYHTTGNFNAAISTGANLLQSSPYSLTGAGVTIGLWDGGAARPSHQEFGARVTVMDGGFTIDHATHVGGTLGASGVAAAARGMAAGATIQSYDWNSDASEMTSRGATYAGEPGKIYLSNHSYGYVSGWNYVNGGTPYRLWEWFGSTSLATSVETDFGLYNFTARDSDSLAYNTPYYLIFRSAGNDNGDTPSNGQSVALSPSSSTVVTYSSASHPAADSNYRGGFETISYDAVAKNVITIGSTADAVTNGTRSPIDANLSYFSSCGPTDDGRIKPDVVANGDSLYSSLSGSDNAYGTYSGTSMATPNAAGSAALLIQQFSSLFPGQAMRASTLKGLLIHTADDRGNAGPDYRYGWGLVNVQAAADLIRDHYAVPGKRRITENQLTTATNTQTHLIEWDGVSPLRATLSWTDPAGTALSSSDSRSARLVNNLNLKVIAPNGAEMLPYVMPFVGTWTQASMDLPATTGTNNTDNVEQIDVATPPAPGIYQVVVSCPGIIINGIQNYSLLISGSDAEPPSIPGVPSNLIATPKGNSVVLAWNAPAGATNYNVKRSLTSGGPYTTLGNTTSTTYTDETALNGITYFYVVSARNSAGEGEDTGEIVATPAPIPSTITLASSFGTSGSYGIPVTFTATVGSGVTSGTVSFFDEDVLLGSGPVSAAGQASYTTSSLALGNHPITAAFSGNSSFSPSTSALFAYSVSPKPVTITGVTAANKVYDKNILATLSGGSVSGLVAGESVTIIAGAGTFSSPNSGSRSVAATGYSITGPLAGNYSLSAQPIVPNATISPRPVQLAGNREYDGTNLAKDLLSVLNNLDGTGLTVTGEAKLTGRNVGLQSISPGKAASRIQVATGSTGALPATTIDVTLNTTPASGNTLIAVISTRGTSANRVSAISQTGASWSRVSQATNVSGTTTEIWFSPNVSAAGAALTITQASLRSAAVVMEYSGVLELDPVDTTSSAIGSSTSAVTGTTGQTSQADELWIGAIGISDGRRTLANPSNAFTSVASTKSGITNSDAMVYALEKVVSSTGSASSGGTLSAADSWAGTIVTFKTVTPTNLALAGLAAGNYTLIGASGSVQVSPRATTVSAVSADKVYDGNTLASGIPTISPPLASEDSPTILSQEFQDEHVGLGNKTIIPTLIINDGNGGANYTITPINSNTGTITPAIAAIEFGNLTHVYNGDFKSAMTTPVNFETSITYNGIATPPTDAGNYTVIATVTEPNYQGSATDTMVIEKAIATISLTNLDQVYDGTPRVVTATPSRPVMSVTITYDGSTVAPTAAGTYAVVAIVNDPNHQGSVTDSLTISLGSNYSSWKALNFTATEQLNGLADEAADPDGDHWPNLAEYALGSDPRESSTSDMILEENDQEGVSLIFTRPANLPSVTYRAESSEDFETWTPVPLEVLSTGALETVRARDPLTTGNPLLRFLRLRFGRE